MNQAAPSNLTIGNAGAFGIFTNACRTSERIRAPPSRAGERRRTAADFGGLRRRTSAADFGGGLRRRTSADLGGERRNSGTTERTPSARRAHAERTPSAE